MVVEVAKLLHESGREAVARGCVYMKGGEIVPRPFCEWDDLPRDAIEGRMMMARFLLRKANARKLAAIFDEAAGNVASMPKAPTPKFKPVLPK
jgi:hypothetical protein